MITQYSHDREILVLYLLTMTRRDSYSDSLRVILTFAYLALLRNAQPLALLFMYKYFHAFGLASPA